MNFEKERKEKFVKIFPKLKLKKMNVFFFFSTLNFLLLCLCRFSLGNSSITSFLVGSVTAIIKVKFFFKIVMNAQYVYGISIEDQ